MKKNQHTNFPCAILFLTAALFAGGCKKSAEPSSGAVNDFKRYPYERFHLTYEYTGDLRGTEELFVSGFGKYEARYSKFEILTPEAIRPVDNSSITRLSDIYVINYLEKSVMHDHVAQLDSLYHLGANDIPSSQEYLESEMKRNLMTNAGKEEIGGKAAVRWQGIDGGMSLWVWNSIMLRKHVVSPNGTMDLTIKTIDTLWTVDTSKFSIPSGLTQKEMPKNAPGTN